jgi:hypothetical protein
MTRKHQKRNLPDFQKNLILSRPVRNICEAFDSLMNSGAHDLDRPKSGFLRPEIL